MGIFGYITNQQIGEDTANLMANVLGEQNQVFSEISENVLLGADANRVYQHRRDFLSVSEDFGLRVAFAGEILNRKEIVRELSSKEALLSTTSDAELFMHLFAEFRSSAPSKINGFFCAAVWDSKHRRLYLFLDRVGGMHGLFYHCGPKGFAFGTKFQTLLVLPWISREVDRRALVEFFTTGYVLPPNSFVDGIKKIKPGEELIFDDSGLKSTMVDRITISRAKREDITVEEFEAVLKKAIGNISSDGIKRAYLLSGGIDSSTTAALASTLESSRLQTFSGAFPNTKYDESRYAKLVSDYYQCDNYTTDLGGTEIIDDLPDLIWHLDEPSLDYSSLPCFHLFREIGKNAPVVISGDGPDHLFGRYYPLAAKIALSQSCRFFGILARLFRLSFLEKIYRAGAGTLHQAYQEIFIIPNWGVQDADSRADVLSLTCRNFVPEVQSYLNIEVLGEDGIEEIYDKLMLMDFYIDGSFGVFQKVGKTAGAYGLVVREPYLDRDVVDLVLDLPIKRKTNGSFLQMLRGKASNKHILGAELGSKILPNEILNKPKQGFVPPLKNWLRQTICKLPAESILSQTTLKDDYVNLPFFNKILREHLSDQRDWTTIIFMLISFDQWLRINIESGAASLPNWKLSDLYDI